MGASLSVTLQPGLPPAPPHPTGLARLRLLREVQRDRLAVVNALQRDYGDVAALAIGPIRIVVVSSPAAATAILRDSVRFGEKGIGLVEAKHLLGEGLLTASGRDWSEGRKAMVGLFRDHNTGRFLAAADASAASVIQHLERRDTTAPLALAHLFERAALETTMRALIGGGLDSDHIEQALAHFRTMGHWVEARIAMPSRLLSTLSWWLSPRARAACRELSAMAAALAGGVEASRLADVLANAGMDVAAIRDQILTVLLAGHETTAAAVAWSLEHLARHPEHAERVATEGAALGDAPDDIARLPFTTAVVKETLRLFPPVWALPRHTRESADVGGFRIRAGTQIIVNVYGIHRHRDGWDDPHAFAPDRFLSARDPAFYLPFGLGARQCIGRHFGFAAAALIVARLSARFRFVPCRAPSGAIAGLTLRPAVPPAYRITPR